MYLTAIVLASGKGLRLKSKVPKPLIKINSKPVIIYSLLLLEKHPLVSEIIVVANPANRREIIKTVSRYRIDKVKSVVTGGPRRQDSVRCGLKELSRQADFILVHDGARPFVSRRDIDLLLRQAKNSGAAILGVPVKQTIKESIGVSGRQSSAKATVKRTLNRDNLWEVQTPQIFKKEVLLDAYRRFGRLDVTDDSALAEKAGAKVTIVPGSYRNIKITTPEDLLLAKTILKG